MQLIGFNLLKILAQRTPDYKRSSINTNIEFNEITEENMDILKDSNVLKISFIFSITYSDPDKSSDKTEDKDTKNQGEVTFEGNMLFSVTKDESKEITKAWKKKQIPDQYRIPLINFIIKKCSTKALGLEDDLNIPLHIPFPQVRPQDNQPKQ